MNSQFTYKIIGGIFLVCVLAGALFLYSEIYFIESRKSEKVNFEIKKGESINDLALRLSDNHIVRSGWLFKKILIFKGIDKDVKAGVYTVEAPITLARVIESLRSPKERIEKTITIIPGWDLRDIAEYFESKNIASAQDFYDFAGEPAVLARRKDNFYGGISKMNFEILKDKPLNISLEGYLAPETYRIFADASLEDVIAKLVEHRDKQFTRKMYDDIRSGGRTVHEILTMASILEREIRSKDDKAKVSDLFWRRYDRNWALQADSTVHYAVGRKGGVFTTKKDRDSLNKWNTYKYPGLPPGPISSPSLDSIMAAIYPKKNDYWYFITTLDGEVKYAKSLEEHNRNIQRYLR